MTQATSAGSGGRGPTPGRASYPMLTPFLESWRTLVLVFAAVALATFVIRFVGVNRRYEARATLMTVSANRTPGAVGSLATLSMLAGQAGFNTPPELVARVLVARGVLTGVALSRVDSTQSSRLIDLLEGEEPADLTLPEIERAIARVLDVSIDRKTGLIDVAVKSRDSSLARLLVTRVVDAGSQAFGEVMRAQASAQRVGQEARLAQRADQLKAAEARSQEFARTHRVVTPYSAAAIEQRELQRAVQLAEQAYSEAISARESAYARELEETPAVVVVDPLPAVLPPVPRYNLFYAIALGLLATFLVATVILLREEAGGLQASDDPRARRFLDALGRIPFLGRLAGRP